MLATISTAKALILLSVRIHIQAEQQSLQEGSLKKTAAAEDCLSNCGDGAPLHPAGSAV